ncbi:MAG: hypothetical protein JSU07_05300, partial [Bacteroidetes bacterium]|nr:hypothetical protein [Bacteroidota bacterium]
NAQPNNALFINYFCGRNVSICENTSLAGGGGRVQVGNFFSAKKHVEIGDATYGISDTSNIALGINANAGKGIVLKTWNNGFPLISINNSNFTSSPFTVFGNGTVRIGTQKLTGNNSDALLQVSGKICGKSLYILKPTNWSDKVFSQTTQETLEDVDKYIKKFKHLPGIESERNIMKNGYDLNKMDAILLEKIEKIYLILIEQSKEIERLTKNKK